MTPTLDQAIRVLIHDMVPRPDRKLLLDLLETEPIRILGGCLVCEEVSDLGIVGVYLPLKESPLQQIVLYRFCPVHREDPRRWDGAAVERMVFEAERARPHVFSVLRAGEVLA